MHICEERLIRFGVALASILFVVLIYPAAASAGTATIDAGGFLYQAASGETNHVYVVQAAGGLRVTDSTAPVTAGSGCTVVTPNEAFCATLFGAHVHVIAGDMNDFVKVSASFLVNGADPIRSQLDGGEGDDELEGGVGPNLMDGGPGADTFHGGPTDTFQAGAGLRTFDVVSYASRTNPVTVTVGDGLANDGEDGESDFLERGIDRVVGGEAGDTLTCNGACAVDPGVSLIGLGGADAITCAGRNCFLFGGPGDDRLQATGESILMGSDANLVAGDRGNDLLLGGSGTESMAGGPGDDELRGGRGRDQLRGKGGSDLLAGGSGQDYLGGDNGPDTVFARDGEPDVIRGGHGDDRARIDRRLDRNMRSIEALF